MDTETTNKKDAKLIRQIARHKHAAFDTFVSQYLQDIYQFVNRYLSNHAHAEDITQDVFLRVWENADKWKPQASASVKSWLYKIAYNRCLDEFRKQKDTDNNVEQLHTAESPEQNVIQNDELEQLHSAINTLPENQRLVLYLCSFQGLSNREAANAMQLSVAAIESLLARARRTLKQKLDSNSDQVIQTDEVQHG